MLDKKLLGKFLCELEIEDAHQEKIFDVLLKISKDEGARELFLSYYTPYREIGKLDYNALYKEALPSISEMLPSVHRYEINLAVLFALAPYSEHFYTEKGHSHKIWIDSILDLKWKMLDCVDINGFAGIRTASLAWFDRWFFGERFAFHRLQFEINPSGKAYKSESFDIKLGEPLISVHIPSARNGIKFDKENREISYQMAREYYGGELGTEKPVFSCNSWLLAPYHSEILPETSNIRQFKEEFEIVSSGVCTWHLPMLFGTESIPEAKDLPESSSIQRAYKKYMLNGGVPMGALGYKY